MSKSQCVRVEHNNGTVFGSREEDTRFIRRMNRLYKKLKAEAPAMRRTLRKHGLPIPAERGLLGLLDMARLCRVAQGPKDVPA